MLVQTRVERRYRWTSTRAKRRFPALNRAGAPTAEEKVPA